MTNPPIRFATDILRRLGEELNPNIDQGILELVKNSYDADARHCTVNLEGIRDAGGRIEVMDDGDGMEYNDIVEGWLVIGRSRKTAVKPTRLNRIPAGNKGLGRLAALRLGDRVDLVTRPHGSNEEYHVTIDWSLYENADLVENVPIDIFRRTRSKEESGTTVTIYNVHAAIGRMDVKRLARALILLSDPFDRGPNSFQPSIASQDFRDLEHLVKRMYFGDAEYHLTANLLEGNASAKVADWRGKTLFEAGHEDISVGRTGFKYDAPDSSFDLWSFILTNRGFETRTTSVSEVRSWIESFGGVHLYLNGLRVAPYGNSGNDWLDMNLRRVQSPEERPSTNTSIGRLSVEDTRAKLAEKTDRSGFIENHHFEELRAFARDSLEWMARRRLAAAEARRQRERTTTPTRSEQSRESLREQIDRVPANIKGQLTTAFAKYDRERQRETDALRQEVQLYRTLSTAGITAATFAHESGGYPLKIISQSVNAIEFRGKKDLGEDYGRRYADPVASIRHACDSLGVLSSATLQLIDSDKRRMGRIDLHEV